MAATTGTIMPPAWLDSAAKSDPAPAIDRVPLSTATVKPPAPAPATPVENRIKPKTPAVSSPVVAPGGESVLCWRGFDAATLVPGTLTLGLITATALCFIAPFVPATWRTETIIAPLGAIWVGHLVRGGYRLLTFRCLLTSKRLFHSFGPLYPRDEAVELAIIGRVEVRQSFWQKLLGVGDVVVVPEESSGRTPVELSGFRRPKAFATLIETTSKAAREGTIKS